jgi:hypothetical protein
MAQEEELEEPPEGDGRDRVEPDRVLRGLAVDAAPVPAGLARVPEVARELAARDDPELAERVDREREVLGGAGLATSASSAATRRLRASISVRSPLTSSRTRSSSIVARMRPAACVTSSISWRVVPDAPSLVAWNVRSIAARTASTVSDAVASGLSFLFFFFAMAQL